MKLDLNAAWDQAVRLLAGNREVIFVLGGVFFFLPLVLFSLLAPMPDLVAAAGPSGENSEALAAAINGFVAQYWWAMVLVALFQAIGAIAVMAVVGDPARPTVQAAMARGGRFFLSQFAVQLLTSLATSLVLFLAVIFGTMTGSQAVMETLSLMALPVIIWLMARLSLSGASIAVEARGNPLTAIARSWHLTRGNGLRLTAFYVLIFAALFVVMQVLGLGVRVVTAFPDAGLARVLGALLWGAIYTAALVIAYAVVASVHRLLARAERVAVPEAQG